MTATFHFTLDDYRNAFRTHFQMGGRPYARWLRRCFIPLGALICIMGGFLLVTGASHEMGVWVCMMIGVLLLWRGMGGAYRWAAKAQFAKSPVVREQNRLEVNDTGLKVDCGIARGEANWKAYTRYVESNDTFLLYTSPALFVIIPKRVLQSDQIDEFRNLLKNNVGKDVPVHVSPSD
jgi:hypothetical protein